MTQNDITEIAQRMESAEYIVASDLEHFIRFLIEDELQLTERPFDKEEVLSKDPAIVNFTGVPLPWEAYR